MAKVQFNHARIAQLTKRQVQMIYGDNEELLTQALDIWQRSQPKKKSKEEGAD